MNKTNFKYYTRCLTWWFKNIYSNIHFLTGDM